MLPLPLIIVIIGVVLETLWVISLIKFLTWSWSPKASVIDDIWTNIYISMSIANIITFVGLITST